MQALEAARRALVQVVEQGDHAEVGVVDAGQHVQRTYQLLQASGDTVQHFVPETVAILAAQRLAFLQADQQVAQRATARLHLAQAVLQLLLQVARVAQAGQRVDQVALLQAGDVHRQHAVLVEQALQGVAQAVGGIHARHQLLVHRGLADEVVDATVEGLHQHVLAFLAGEQDDVGVVLGRLVQLAHPAGQLQAVHLRHQPVGQQHAGRALLQQAQGFGGAVGEAHVLVAGLAQSAADDGAGELGVVHHQDAEMGVGH